MELTILGDCPSKKNSKIMSFKGSRPMLFSSRVYRLWHTDAMKQLLGKKPESGKIVAVTLVFYPRTKRQSDLTNRAESVMDTLVDAGLLPDDNWFVVPQLFLTFGGVDTVNPRVEIDISYER